jgi:hypothetical protein
MKTKIDMPYILSIFNKLFKSFSQIEKTVLKFVLRLCYDYIDRSYVSDRNCVVIPIHNKFYSKSEIDLQSNITKKKTQ